MQRWHTISCVIVTNTKIIITDNDISCIDVTNIKIILSDNILIDILIRTCGDLVLFNLLLELLILNLNIQKSHTEFWGNLQCCSALYTLNSACNEKKYAEILLHYRWLFVEGNVIIGEWGMFGVEIFLRYSRFFVKGDFVIGGVGCM